MEERITELVSIIVPAYNAQATLDRCLSACLAQSYTSTEVILVDDGSTDETPLVAGMFPSVRYIRQENKGPAAARNLGAYEAHGNYIAYADSDCVPEPEWVERLRAGFADGVVAVGGTYGIANPECRLARIVQAEIAMRHDRCKGEVDFLGSFNVMYRKDAFMAVGGFDEAFRHASGEDNDLAYRLVDVGGRLRFVADARVLHYHPERLLPYLKTQMRHGFWRVKLYRKHPCRASSGDKYAGRVDMLSPALTLFFVLVLLALPFALPFLRKAPFVSVSLLTVAVLCEVAYYAMRIKAIVGLRRRLGKAGAFPYGIDDFFFLRDVARGVGMLKGIWHFIVLRKETV